MQTLWNRLKTATTSEQQLRDELLRLVPQLVKTYGDAAAELAIEWYEQAREQEIGLDGWHASMKNLSGYPSAAIQDTIRWKAGLLWHDDDNPSARPDPDALATFLQGAVDRWVHYSSREAIITNVLEDPKARGYAIVPAGKCCAWCAMIASRGFDYTSHDTAKASTHNGCDCEAVPGWGKEKRMAILRGYDPDAYYDAYKTAANDIFLNPQDLKKKIASSRTSAADRRLLRRKHMEITAMRNSLAEWWPKYRKKQAIFDGTSDITSYKAMLAKLGKDRIPQSVKQHATLTLMRYQNPDEFTDGLHPETASAGDLKLSDWLDFRASLAERQIKKDNRSFLLPPEIPARVPSGWPTESPSLTTSSWNHVLYGSRKIVKIKEGNDTKKIIKYTGGHMFGYGWIAERDEFPQVWTAKDIFNAARQIITSTKPIETGNNVFYRGTYNGYNLYIMASRKKDGTLAVHTITPDLRRRE